MKKIAIVFVVLVFLFCVTGEVFAGGINLDFEISDARAEKFAREFMSEMVKKKIFIDQFVGYYFVRGFIGAIRDNETGQTRSAIGIFVDDNEKPVTTIWFDGLFSMQEIKKKAKEVADYIFEYLKRKEEEKKKSIKIPV